MDWDNFSYHPHKDTIYHFISSSAFSRFMLLEHNKCPHYDRSRAASYIWLRIESNLLFMYTAWDQTYWFWRRYTSIASMFRSPLSVFTRLEAISMSPFGSKLEVSLRTKGLLVDRRDAWVCNELLYVAWSSLRLTPQRASLNAVLAICWKIICICIQFVYKQSMQGISKCCI